MIRSRSATLAAYDVAVHLSTRREYGGHSDPQSPRESLRALRQLHAHLHEDPFPGHRHLHECTDPMHDGNDGLHHDQDADLRRWPALPKLIHRQWR